MPNIRPKKTWRSLRAASQSAGVINEFGPGKSKVHRGEQKTPENATHPKTQVIDRSQNLRFRVCCVFGCSLFPSRRRQHIRKCNTTEKKQFWERSTTCVFGCVGFLGVFWRLPKFQWFSGSDILTCMLPTFCLPTISLELCGKPSILEADDFLGACYRKARTPNKLWTLFFSIWARESNSETGRIRFRR